ncbi:endonuclease/exonuclease/phosphatase family protein [Planctomyces sp. SH-PL14]|uniref:endonuclease/exonuclease/phosphatase family protein n=1 Tax=Planctomyces sp. SH-PL14 TaxID=1632864 RepID=UPI00078D9E92|nr:endonuclease/exonuclease/phosphatase family protein [Planctomyces sp. SH-PL14]AMV22091.1 hypothetical protein VT03_29580 [Planctomyces sp. SH-PL14]
MMSQVRVFLLAIAAVMGGTDVARADDVVRFATFNVSMFRSEEGELIRGLQGGKDEGARRVAEIVQTVRPDVLLLNEFDYDAEEKGAHLLCSEYLQVSQNGRSPILYPFVFTAPVNTGVPSGQDLDGNGKVSGSGDAFGFGKYPGQYGMVVLSRFPIDAASVRTFQKFLWKDMPGAKLPLNPGTGRPFYSEEALAVLRLSSKSHWDIPLQMDGGLVHVLVAHPTPPVFDGPEDRNGCRNHDEIRLWSDYIDPSRGNGYLYDDQGRRGGLAAGAKFVILGDYNADPKDGESVGGAIDQFVKHPLVHHDAVPSSVGGEEATQMAGGIHRSHLGPPGQDTANFESSGNLRVDYVLPSRTLGAYRAGVYWPAKSEGLEELVSVSDHRLVWVDVEIGR